MILFVVVMLTTKTKNPIKPNQLKKPIWLENWGITEHMNWFNRLKLSQFVQVHISKENGDLTVF